MTDQTRNINQLPEGQMSVREIREHVERRTGPPANSEKTWDDRTILFLCDVLDELNKLRSNMIATQSASWSNLSYPLVAILDRAGCEVDRDVSGDDRAAHLFCYGGAGGSPNHFTPPIVERMCDLHWKSLLNTQRGRAEDARKTLSFGDSPGSMQ